MGLFDIFRKPKPDSAAAPTQTTAAAPKTWNECYAAEFRAEMARVGLVSAEEVEGALALICAEDGCTNQHRYHQQVFDQYFRDRKWRWPWYDEWSERFKAFGAYPVRWPVFHAYSPPTSNQVVYRLTVANLKALMKSAGLVYPPTAKGAALRALALESPENRSALERAPLWNTLVPVEPHSEGYGEYTMLMRTILFRSKCISGRNRAHAVGLTGWAPVGIDKQDQRFIDYALSLDPNSSTPLHPGDVTVMRCSVLGFDD